MTLEELLAKPDWMRRAACVGLPTEWFFPEQGGDYRKAKAICASCTVRAECKEAGQYERFGVWGGGSEKQRKVQRRETPKLIDHGSPNGYEQHRRAGTDACHDCLRAHALDKAAKKNGGVLPSIPEPVNHPGMIGPARRWALSDEDVA